MTDEMDDIRPGGGRMVLLGIVTIMCGLAAMMAPFLAGVSVSLVAGILLAVGGVLRMIWAFGSDTLGQGVAKFLIGGLTLVCGLVVLGRPLLGLASLTLVIAAYFVVDGIFEIVAALEIKPDQGWGWLLFGGLVSLLLGLMIWRQFPLSGAWATGMLVGIKLLFAGLEMTVMGTVVRAGGNAMAAASPTEEE